VQVLDVVGHYCERSVGFGLSANLNSQMHA
jgi:hypothetical protein